MANPQQTRNWDGMAIVAAYPVYSRALKKERERVAPEILRLTDELMK